MDFIKTRDDDETANLIWNDSAVQHEKIAELRNYQVYSMFTMSSQYIFIGAIISYRLEWRACMLWIRVQLLHIAKYGSWTLQCITVKQLENMDVMDCQVNSQEIIATFENECFEQHIWK